jgi:hypothetical protein
MRAIETAPRAGFGADLRSLGRYQLLEIDSIAEESILSVYPDMLFCAGFAGRIGLRIGLRNGRNGRLDCWRWRCCLGARQAIKVGEQGGLGGGAVVIHLDIHGCILQGAGAIERKAFIVHDGEKKPLFAWLQEAFVNIGFDGVGDLVGDDAEFGGEAFVESFDWLAECAGK